MPAPPSAPAATAAAERPLAPFEHLMLVDARPGFSMCFFVECRVHGPLDQARLRAAVTEAARRHPLLCSRVANPVRRPRWLPPDVIPTVVWHPQAGNPWEAIDLTRESGLRVVVVPDGPDRQRVVMQVHHSACDGIAACEYFGDVWAAYAGLPAPPFASGRPATASAPVGSGATSAPRAPGAALEFARFRPAPLARVAAPPPEREPSLPPLPYATLQFDTDFTGRLRTAAGRQAVSLNDVLIAAVMRAVLAWNDAAGGRPGNVRLTMPVSLRATGSREPARNAIGYAFLDRQATECGGLASLATSIAAATRWVIDTGAAAAFLGTLAWLARRPWLLRLVTRLPVCFSTAVFSNVGEASRRMRSGVPRRDGRDAPADLVIEGFVGVPPLRPRTLVAVGGTTYANALALTCLCAAGPDPRAAAAAFLRLVRAELESFAVRV